MKIINKYFIKQFLQTTVFGLIAFTLVFVIIDLMENLDDFIDQDVPNYLIIQYYFVFIPEIIRLMTPIAVLLSVLFTIGKMSTRNELTAVKSSGVSLYRIMIPFVITALLISIASTYFGGFIVPMANKHKVYIEQTYMKKGIERHAGNNIFFQDSKSRIVTISYYDVVSDRANRISIQEFDPDDLTQMASRIDALKMTYDSTTSEWNIIDGVRREFTDRGEVAEKFNELKLNYLNFTPSDVIKKQRKPEEMTLDELDEYAQDQLRTGNDPTRIKIEYHSRVAFAFASFVVILFGLPFSVNKRRTGLAIQFGISILITFIYLVFMKVSQAFGKNGVLDPLPTAWFANIVFFVGAIINIARAQK